MSANIHFDPATSIFELRISGILKRSEFVATENEFAAHIAAGERPLVLVVLNHFGGWEHGEDWNNLEFMFTHGEKIAKIAIVGAGTKESEVRAFTGAGIRSTPVNFFTAAEIEQARAWLLL